MSTCGPKSTLLTQSCEYVSCSLQSTNESGTCRVPGLLWSVTSLNAWHPCSRVKAVEDGLDASRHVKTREVVHLWRVLSQHAQENKRKPVSTLVKSLYCAAVCGMNTTDYICRAKSNYTTPIYRS